MAKINGKDEINNEIIKKIETESQEFKQEALEQLKQAEQTSKQIEGLINTTTSEVNTTKSSTVLKVKKGGSSKKSPSRKTKIKVDSTIPAPVTDAMQDYFTKLENKNIGKETEAGIKVMKDYYNSTMQSIVETNKFLEETAQLLAEKAPALQLQSLYNVLVSNVNEAIKEELTSANYKYAQSISKNQDASAEERALATAAIREMDKIKKEYKKRENKALELKKASNKEVGYNLGRVARIAQEKKGTAYKNKASQKMARVERGKTRHSTTANISNEFKQAKAASAISAFGIEDFNDKNPYSYDSSVTNAIIAEVASLEAHREKIEKLESNFRDKNRAEGSDSSYVDFLLDLILHKDSKGKMPSFKNQKTKDVFLDKNTYKDFKLTQDQVELIRQRIEAIAVNEAEGVLDQDAIDAIKTLEGRGFATKSALAYEALETKKVVENIIRDVKSEVFSSSIGYYDEQSKKRAARRGVAKESQAKISKMASHPMSPKTVTKSSGSFGASAGEKGLTNQLKKEKSTFKKTVGAIVAEGSRKNTRDEKKRIDNIKSIREAAPSKDDILNKLASEGKISMVDIENDFVEGDDSKTNPITLAKSVYDAAKGEFTNHEYYYVMQTDKKGDKSVSLSIEALKTFLTNALHEGEDYRDNVAKELGFLNKDGTVYTPEQMQKAINEKKSLIDSFLSDFYNGKLRNEKVNRVTGQKIDSEVMSSVLFNTAEYLYDELNSSKYIVSANKRHDMPIMAKAAGKSAEDIKKLQPKLLDMFTLNTPDKEDGYVSERWKYSSGRTASVLEAMFGEINTKAHNALADEKAQGTAYVQMMRNPEKVSAIVEEELELAADLYRNSANSELFVLDGSQIAPEAKDWLRGYFARRADIIQQKIHGNTETPVSKNFNIESLSDEEKLQKVEKYKESDKTGFDQFVEQLTNKIWASGKGLAKRIEANFSKVGQGKGEGLITGNSIRSLAELAGWAKDNGVTICYEKEETGDYEKYHFYCIPSEDFDPTNIELSKKKVFADIQWSAPNEEGATNASDYGTISDYFMPSEYGFTDVNTAELGAKTVAIRNIDMTKAKENPGLLERLRNRLSGISQTYSEFGTANGYGSVDLKDDWSKTSISRDDITEEDKARKFSMNNWLGTMLNVMMSKRSREALADITGVSKKNLDPFKVRKEMWKLVSRYLIQRNNNPEGYLDAIKKGEDKELQDFIANPDLKRLRKLIDTYFNLGGGYWINSLSEQSVDNGKSYTLQSADVSNQDEANILYVQAESSSRAKAQPNQKIATKKDLLDSKVFHENAMRGNKLSEDTNTLDVTMMRMGEKFLLTVLQRDAKKNVTNGELVYVPKVTEEMVLGDAVYEELSKYQGNLASQLVSAEDISNEAISEFGLTSEQISDAEVNKVFNIDKYKQSPTDRKLYVGGGKFIPEGAYIYNAIKTEDGIKFLYMTQEQMRQGLKNTSSSNRRMQHQNVDRDELLATLRDPSVEFTLEDLGVQDPDAIKEIYGEDILAFRNDLADYINNNNIHVFSKQASTKRSKSNRTQGTYNYDLMEYLTNNITTKDLFDKLVENDKIGKLFAARYRWDAENGSIRSNTEFNKKTGKRSTLSGQELFGTDEFWEGIGLGSMTDDIKKHLEKLGVTFKNDKKGQGVYTLNNSDYSEKEILEMLRASYMGNFVKEFGNELVGLGSFYYDLASASKELGIIDPRFIGMLGDLNPSGTQAAEYTGSNGIGANQVGGARAINSRRLRENTFNAIDEAVLRGRVTPEAAEKAKQAYIEQYKGRTRDVQIYNSMVAAQNNQSYKDIGAETTDKENVVFDLVIGNGNGRLFNNTDALGYSEMDISQLDFNPPEGKQTLTDEEYADFVMSKLYLFAKDRGEGLGENALFRISFKGLDDNIVKELKARGFEDGTILAFSPESSAKNAHLILDRGTLSFLKNFKIVAKGNATDDDITKREFKVHASDNYRASFAESTASNSDITKAAYGSKSIDSGSYRIFGLDESEFGPDDKPYGVISYQGALNSLALGADPIEQDIDNSFESILADVQSQEALKNNSKILDEYNLDKFKNKNLGEKKRIYDRLRKDYIEAIYSNLDKGAILPSWIVSNPILNESNTAYGLKINNPQADQLGSDVLYLPSIIADLFNRDFDGDMLQRIGNSIKDPEARAVFLEVGNMLLERRMEAQADLEKKEETAIGIATQQLIESRLVTDPNTAANAQINQMQGKRYLGTSSMDRTERLSQMDAYNFALVEDGTTESEANKLRAKKRMFGAAMAQGVEQFGISSKKHMMDAITAKYSTDPAKLKRIELMFLNYDPKKDKDLLNEVFTGADLAKDPKIKDTLSAIEKDYGKDSILDLVDKNGMFTIDGLEKVLLYSKRVGDSFDEGYGGKGPKSANAMERVKRLKNILNLLKTQSLGAGLAEEQPKRVYVDTSELDDEEQTASKNRKTISGHGGDITYDGGGILISGDATIIVQGDATIESGTLTDSSGNIANVSSNKLTLNDIINETAGKTIGIEALHAAKDKSGEDEHGIYAKGQKVYTPHRMLKAIFESDPNNAAFAKNWVILQQAFTDILDGVFLNGKASNLGMVDYKALGYSNELDYLKLAQAAGGATRGLYRHSIYEALANSELAKGKTIDELLQNNTWKDIWAQEKSKMLDINGTGYNKEFAQNYAQLIKMFGSQEAADRYINEENAITSGLRRLKGSGWNQLLSLGEKSLAAEVFDENDRANSSYLVGARIDAAVRDVLGNVGIVDFKNYEGGIEEAFQVLMEALLLRVNLQSTDMAKEILQELGYSDEEMAKLTENANTLSANILSTSGIGDKVGSTLGVANIGGLSPEKLIFAISKAYGLKVTGESKSLPISTINGRKIDSYGNVIVGEGSSSSISKAFLSNQRAQYQVEEDILRAEGRGNKYSGDKKERNNQYIAQLRQRLSMLKSEQALIDLSSLSEEERVKLNGQLNDLASKHEVAQSRINVTLNQQTSLLEKLTGSLSQQISGFFDISLINTGINKFKQGIQQLISVTEELDSKMVNLQIATGGNREETHALLIEYTNLAKTLGRTTSEMADAANSWYRSGYRGEEAMKLTEASMQLSTLGMIDQANATSYLVSALKGWKLEAEDVSRVVDKLVALDMSAAVSSGELAEAMSRANNSARLAGVSMDTYAGYITTVVDTTQKSAESVGQSFQTIFSRFLNIKAAKFAATYEDTQAEGYSEDNFESLNDVETVLNKVGIKVRENASDWRSIEDVIEEIASKWDTWDKTTQNAVATAVAGTRQRENVVTLFENYDQVGKFAEIAADSYGTAKTKMEAYTNSVEAAKKRLTVATEEWALKLDLSDAIKWFYNTLAKATENIDKLLISGGLALLLSNPTGAGSLLTNGLSKIGNTLVNFGTSNPMGSAFGSVTSSIQDAYETNVRTQYLNALMNETNALSASTQLTLLGLDASKAATLTTLLEASVKQQGVQVSTEEIAQTINSMSAEELLQLRNFALALARNVGVAVDEGLNFSSTDLGLSESQLTWVIDVLQKVFSQLGQDGIQLSSKMNSFSNLIGSSSGKLAGIGAGIGGLLGSAAGMYGGSGVIESLGISSTSTGGMIGTMGLGMAGMYGGKVLGGALLGGLSGGAGGLASGVGSALGLGSGAIGAAGALGIVGIAAAVVGALIYGIVKKIKKEAEAKALAASQEAFKEAETNLTAAKSVTSAAKKVDELAKGVDEFGNNVSLSDEDYQEFLDNSNKLSDAFPEMVSRVDEAGNKIVKLGNVSEETADKVNQLQNVSDQALLQPNLFEDAVKQMKEELSGYQGTIDELQEDIDLLRIKGQLVFKTQEAQAAYQEMLESGNVSTNGEISDKDQQVLDKYDEHKAAAQEAINTYNEMYDKYINGNSAYFGLESIRSISPEDADAFAYASSILASMYGLSPDMVLLGYNNTGKKGKFDSIIDDTSGGTTDGVLSLDKQDLSNATNTTIFEKAQEGFKDNQEDLERTKASKEAAIKELEQLKKEALKQLDDYMNAVLRAETDFSTESSEVLAVISSTMSGLIEPESTGNAEQDLENYIKKVQETYKQLSQFFKDNPVLIDIVTKVQTSDTIGEAYENRLELQNALLETLGNDADGISAEDQEILFRFGFEYDPDTGFVKDIKDTFTLIKSLIPKYGFGFTNLGLYGEGNIDLYNRPLVQDKEGNIATVQSMSFEEDGKLILIPMVYQDANGQGKIFNSPEEAIEYYHKTGQYLGKFDTIDEANDYAMRLHNQLALRYTGATYQEALLDYYGVYDMSLEKGNKFYELLNNGTIVADPEIFTRTAVNNLLRADMSGGNTIEEALGYLALLLAAAPGLEDRLHRFYGKSQTGGVEVTDSMVAQEFNDLPENLRNAIKDGANELREGAKEMNEVMEESTEAYMQSLANSQANIAKNMASKYFKGVDSDNSGYIDTWSEMSDMLDRMISGYKKLDDAITEQNNHGRLSLQTTLALLSTNEEYINLLDEEALSNGELKLAGDAKERLMQIEIAAAKAQLLAKKASLEASIAAKEAQLEEYKATGVFVEGENQAIDANAAMVESLNTLADGYANVAAWATYAGQALQAALKGEVVDEGLKPTEAASGSHVEAYREKITYNDDLGREKARQLEASIAAEKKTLATVDASLGYFDKVEKSGYDYDTWKKYMETPDDSGGSGEEDKLNKIKALIGSINKEYLQYLSLLEGNKTIASTDKYMNETYYQNMAKYLQLQADEEKRLYEMYKDSDPEKAYGYLGDYQETTLKIKNLDDERVQDRIDILENSKANAGAIRKEYELLLLTADSYQEQIEYQQKLNDAIMEEIEAEKEIISLLKEKLELRMKYTSYGEAGYSSISKKYVQTAEDELDKAREAYATKWQQSYNDNITLGLSSSLAQEAADKESSSELLDVISAIEGVSDAYFKIYENMINSLDRQLEVLEKSRPDEWTDSKQIEEYYSKRRQYAQEENDLIMQILNNVSERSKYTDELIEEMIDKYNDNLDDIISKVLELLDKVDLLNEQYSAITDTVNIYINDLQKQKEIMEDYYDTEIEKLQDKQTSIERTNKLIELQNNLLNAQLEKQRVYKEGIGWVYTPNRTKQKEAQKALDDFNLLDNITDLLNAKEAEAKALLDSIDNWNEYLEMLEYQYKEYDRIENARTLRELLQVETDEEVYLIMLNDQTNFISYRENGWTDHNANMETIYGSFISTYDSFLEEYKSNNDQLATEKQREKTILNSKDYTGSNSITDDEIADENEDFYDYDAIDEQYLSKYATDVTKAGANYGVGDSEGKWKTDQSNGRAWYATSDDTYAAGGWYQIGNKWYYFDDLGYAIDLSTGKYGKQGFTDEQQSDSLYNVDSKYKSKYKYLYELAGNNLTTTTSNSGIKTASNITTGSGSGSYNTGWNQDSTGWWYANSSTGYAANGWQKIDGRWYEFDSNGYIKTDSSHNGDQGLDQATFEALMGTSTESALKVENAANIVNESSLNVNQSGSIAADKILEAADNAGSKAANIVDEAANKFVKAVEEVKDLGKDLSLQPEEVSTKENQEYDHTNSYSIQEYNYLKQQSISEAEDRVHPWNTYTESNTTSGSTYTTQDRYKYQLSQQASGTGTSSTTSGSTYTTLDRYKYQLSQKTSSASSSTPKLANSSEATYTSGTSYQSGTIKSAIESFVDKITGSSTSTASSTSKANDPELRAKAVAGDRQALIEAVADQAMADYYTTGLLPSVSIALTIIESQSGKHSGLSDLANDSNNLFGIKKGSSWTGETTVLPTKEYDKNGNVYWEDAEFRAYDSWADSVSDHADLISRRYSGVKDLSTYQELSQYLKNKGYSTYDEYNVLLNNLINQYGLDAYDDLVKQGTLENKELFSQLELVFGEMKIAEYKNSDALSKSEYALQANTEQGIAQIEALGENSISITTSNGQVIEMNSMLTDSNGNLIDINGRVIDTEGMVIDSNGNLITSNGNMVTSNGLVINSNGKLVTAVDSLTAAMKGFSWKDDDDGGGYYTSGSNYSYTGDGAGTNNEWSSGASASKSTSTLGAGTNNEWSSGASASKSTAESVKATAAAKNASYGGKSSSKTDKNGTLVSAYFSEGIENGPVTFTGLAMLHGTPNSPEYVLNSDQAYNLLRYMATNKFEYSNKNANANTGTTYNLSGDIVLENCNDPAQFWSDVTRAMNNRFSVTRKS